MSSDVAVHHDTEPLDLDAIEARIERHRCPANTPRPGHPDAADLSRLIEEDAPALVAEVRHLRRKLDDFPEENRNA